MKIINERRQRVIVHGYGGEPVVLELYDVDYKGFSAKVGKAGCRRPIRLPASQVLVFDADLMERLSEAYMAGDVDGLRELYASGVSCLQYLQN